MLLRLAGIGGIGLASPLALRPHAAWGQDAASTLRIGMAAPNTTMDPHLQSNAPNNAVATHIFDSLIVNDEASRSQPGLAQSWRVVDDTHWEFSLRPDVRFSDGTPFTAEDAIVSFDRATNLPSTSSFRTYTRSIKSMQAKGPHTLLIETRAPDPLLLNSLSRIRIISAKFKDATTADYNSGRAAIGTGPFVLAEFASGSRVTLDRNPNYWGPRLPWSRVVLSIVPATGARLAGLLAGDLDMIEAVPAENEERIKASGNLHLISGISSRLVYFAFDQERDQATFITDNDGKPLPTNPLKDLRVRQALSMAINRQAIVDRVMEGNAVIASQFLPKGGFGTSPALAPETYDAVRAKALLAEAGYPNGFRITLHGPNDRYINDGKIVQAVAQMLTRIGIQTRAEVMPWTAYAGRSDKAEFSMFLNAWGVNTGETSNPLGAIAATYDRESGLGVANSGRYSNPKLDALVKQALRTMDDKERGRMLAEASELLFRDVGIAPLHHEVSIWAARKNITYATRADQYTLAMGVGQTA
ncbi:ABC transporter substrate-binding protein [Limobrevibacterium gyesilva]|uniref:ABC transporter substrate-binding protein n=1 Tax=Limobrevibacterium gyesilva TaxID=2991712 RepID=A0AA42CG39_9PROT|nr:ABC transporter substrate-binding protein [Limobrevibacterium gyesilva]MCW3477304.1 ABC transporter substrate-binding protein [Limobrevibacterium gyesilva]